MTTIDLTFRALFAASGYRITGQYDGVDLVNGGKHMAVDVGNFGMNDPILSPISGRARGLYNFDTAIGIEYVLGDGWTLEMWHLNATLAPLEMVPGRSALGTWQDVSRGQVCGRTGNSGAQVNGGPMPAHTHIELQKGGLRYDAEPYLLGTPFNTVEADMLPDFPPLATCVIGEGNNLRSAPRTSSDARVLQSTTAWDVLGAEDKAGSYSLGGKTRTDWVFVRRGKITGWVARALAAKLVMTTEGAALFPPAPDAAALELQTKIDRAKTALGGASRAHIAEGQALTTAEAALA